MEDRSLPLHLAITDETGNTAVLEYLDGKLSIHEGKEYRVMTNSPRYEQQLAINDYWKEIGGLQMLPEPIGQATVLYGLHSTFMPFPKLRMQRLQFPAY